MSVLLKRSEAGLGLNECPYGCCTPLYGKNVNFIRRTLKRRERAAWKKEVAND